MNKKLIVMGLAAALLLSGTSAYAASSAGAGTHVKKVDSKAGSRADAKAKREARDVKRLTPLAKKLGIDAAGKTSAELKQEIKARLAELKAKQKAANTTKGHKQAAKGKAAAAAAQS